MAFGDGWVGKKMNIRLVELVNYFNYLETDTEKKNNLDNLIEIYNTKILKSILVEENSYTCKENLKNL